MKIDRVSFQKIYPTGMNYINHRIGFEAILNEGEDAVAAVEQLRDLADIANLKTNHSFAVAMEYTEGSNPPPKPTSEEQRIAALIQDINACTSVSETSKWGKEVGLLSFEPMVTDNDNDKLTAAYNAKYFELTNQSK